MCLRNKGGLDNNCACYFRMSSFYFGRKIIVIVDVMVVSFNIKYCHKTGGWWHCGESGNNNNQKRRGGTNGILNLASVAASPRVCSSRFTALNGNKYVDVYLQIMPLDTVIYFVLLGL